MLSPSPFLSQSGNPQYGKPQKRDKWLRKLLWITLSCNFISSIYISISYHPEELLASFFVAFWLGLWIFGIIGGIISVIKDLIYALTGYPKDWV